MNKLVRVRSDSAPPRWTKKSHNAPSLCNIKTKIKHPSIFFKFIIKLNIIFNKLTHHKFQLVLFNCTRFKTQKISNVYKLKQVIKINGAKR